MWVSALPPARDATKSMGSACRSGRFTVILAGSADGRAPRPFNAQDSCRCVHRQSNLHGSWIEGVGRRQHPQLRTHGTMFVEPRGTRKDVQSTERRAPSHFSAAASAISWTAPNHAVRPLHRAEGSRNLGHGLRLLIPFRPGSGKPCRRARGRRLSAKPLQLCGSRKSDIGATGV